MTATVDPIYDQPHAEPYKETRPSQHDKLAIKVRSAQGTRVPGHVAVGVCAGAACNGNPGSPFRIAKLCQPASDGGEKEGKGNGRTRAGPPGPPCRLAPVEDHAQERSVEKGFHLQRLADGSPTAENEDARPNDSTEGG